MCLQIHPPTKTTSDCATHPSINILYLFQDKIQSRCTILRSVKVTSDSSPALELEVLPSNCNPPYGFRHCYIYKIRYVWITFSLKNIAHRQNNSPECSSNWLSERSYVTFLPPTHSVNSPGHSGRSQVAKADDKNIAPKKPTAERNLEGIIILVTKEWIALLLYIPLIRISGLLAGFDFHN